MNSSGPNVNMNYERVRHRRPYSKTGCQNCKKRKLKCDENKPECRQCIHSKLTCVYGTVGRPFDWKKTTIFTESDYNAQVEKRSRRRTHGCISSPDTPTSSNSGESTCGPKDVVLDNYVMFPSDGVNGLASSLNRMISIYRQLAGAELGLNDDQIKDIKILDDELSDSSRYSTSLLPDLNECSYGYPDDQDSSYTDADSFNHMKYFRAFYHIKCHVILPFSDAHHDAFRYTLVSYAKQYPYLLAALLSCGARGHEESHSSADDAAHFTYLSYCLKLLGMSLADEKSLESQAEPMLLTMLMLTADNAAARSPAWIAHLKGTRDLLCRYTSGKSVSPVLTLCRLWFSSIDLIAGMSLPGGPILDSDCDVDALMSSDSPQAVEHLKTLHLLTDKNFNLFYGFNNNCVCVFRSIQKLLLRFRTTNSTVEYAELAEIMVDIERGRQLVEISPTGIIPPQIDASNISEKDCGSIETIDGYKIRYYWKDIVHQSSLETALVTLLTHRAFFGLDSSHHLVQDSIERLLRLFVFADDKDMMNMELSKDERFGKLRWCYPLLHIHFAAAMAGRHCINKQQQDKLRRVFEAIIYQKAGTARYSLEKLENIWMKCGTGGPDNEEIIPY